MQQTFYIDIDEEISSVIDRLKKSMAKDNYFVVPQRALFMQSAVNLKLLKREADKIGKQVVLVTQDEAGASMAQRSGINVRLTLEGLESAPDAYSENIEEKDSNHEELISIEDNMITKINQDKQARLNNIGSNDFYDSSSDSQIKEKKIKAVKSMPRKIPVTSTGYVSEPKKNTKKTVISDSLHQEISQNDAHKMLKSQNFTRESSAKIKYDIFSKKYSEAEKLNSRKEKTLEKIFSSLPREQSKPVANNAKKLGKKSKKIFFGFMLFCLLILLSVTVYLLAPNAKITIIPNISKDKIDINIYVSNSAQADASNIPIRVIDQTQDISLSYDVTGKNAVSGKKAHGSVVIYNEYNSSPQTLIATTRLESADSKIFRLTKNVVVPGTTVVGGSSQPGAIEAEVIADQAGSDYNIDQTKFTVPGFAGGPKFDKFYAKSSASMTGGSSDGDIEPTVVSQQDIDNAKIKTEADAKEKINDVISGELQAGEVALPQAEKITITKSSSGAKIGDIVNSFNYNVQISIRALVFSGNDVKKIIQQSLSEQSQSQDSSQEISKIDYGNVEADFDNSTLNLKVLGEIKIIPNIDVEKIKKEMLGKKSDQLGDILKKYPSIKNANVELWPSFISHIPQYSKRVNVQIDTSGQ